MNDLSRFILSIAYFPPIQYFSKLTQPVCIEKHENYCKQSYRNRCIIYGANGKQILVIPVKKINGNHTKITDILLDYDINWQVNHLRSIESAYKSSPFYEFYIDDLIPFFNEKHKYLFDFNMKIIETVADLLQINLNVSFSNLFITNNKEYIDFRDTIHPKDRMVKPDNGFKVKEYNQVFMEKHGFIQNLSIIDLLFNEGPQSVNILKECIIEAESSKLKS